MRLSFFILQVLASVLSVIANVEKVVFLGPEQINKCYYRSRVDASHRDVLTPASSSIRREIAATFLSPYNSWKGSEFWIVLDDLEPLRRYEVRLCWSATQPTALSLSVHNPDEVFNSIELNSSFFSQPHTRDIQHRSVIALKDFRQPDNQCSEWSALFLHLFASADYFTTYESLMRDVPPVKVEIILDPFFLNILPRSLLPTALYLATLTVISSILSAFIWKGIRRLAHFADETSKDKGTKNELPAELILSILSLVDVYDLPALVCAVHGLLSHHGITPPVPGQEAAAMRRIRGYQLRPICRLHNLPVELTILILTGLNTVDRINFAIAMWSVWMQRPPRPH